MYSKSGRCHGSACIRWTELSDLDAGDNTVYILIYWYVLGGVSLRGPDWYTLLIYMNTFFFVICVKVVNMSLKVYFENVWCWHFGVRIREWWDVIVILAPLSVKCWFDYDLIISDPSVYHWIIIRLIIDYGIWFLVLPNHLDNGAFNPWGAGYH